MNTIQTIKLYAEMMMIHLPPSKMAKPANEISANIINLYFYNEKQHFL